jgi:hypothetical protein
MGNRSAEDQADEAMKMNERLMYKAQQISSTSGVRSAHVRNAPLHQDCLDLGHRAGQNRFIRLLGCHRAPAVNAGEQSKEADLILWKPVPGFADYEISENGDLRHGLKYLKPERTHGNGRKRFALSVKGRIFRFKAAQLVAMAFIGPRPSRLFEVCHNDGFEHNNHYSNLRWDRHIGNSADTLKHKVQRQERAGFRVHKHLRMSAESTAFLARAPR